MTGYFITATGTGIGKTLITAALTAQLRAKGEAVRALKPVISGFGMEGAATSDSGHLLRAQGLPVTQETLQAISPWRFALPLSPDMAAEEEGGEVDFAGLVAFCRLPEAGITLIEGVGGVMSPITQAHTVLDWMAALRLPVLLVAGTYLGALSHTLAAVSAIRACGLELKAVLLSESESPEVGLERTARSLRRFLPAGVPLALISRIGSIEGLDSSLELWKNMGDLTGFIR